MLPANAEHISVLRMVIKENLSRDMVDLLTHDLRKATHALAKGASIHPRRARKRAVC